MKLAGCLALLIASLCIPVARSNAATVRGQLVCNNGAMPAIGVAVTLFSPQFGRVASFFTGGDGMYYFTVPPGAYTLQIWFVKASQVPNLAYPVIIGEPMTDIPRVNLPFCMAE